MNQQTSTGVQLNITRVAAIVEILKDHREMNFINRLNSLRQSSNILEEILPTIYQNITMDIIYIKAIY
jgi:hypothetical protein